MDTRLVRSRSGKHAVYRAERGVEAVAAITVRARRGSTNSGDAATAIANFRRDFVQGYYAIPISLAVVRHAMDLAEKHGLRGCDAVQFASAPALLPKCFCLANHAITNHAINGTARVLLGYPACGQEVPLLHWQARRAPHSERPFFSPRSVGFPASAPGTPIKPYPNKALPQ